MTFFTHKTVPGRVPSPPRKLLGVERARGLAFFAIGSLYLSPSRDFSPNTLLPLFSVLLHLGLEGGCLDWVPGRLEAGSIPERPGR